MNDALSINELSDVNPTKLLVLHRASLDEKDVEQRQAFTMTRPLRSFADLAAAESVSQDIVEQALTEGRRRGLVTEREISDLRHREQLAKWFAKRLAMNQR